MFTRKSVFVALTVIAMLAMLVPAAAAAPELVAGVTVTGPTTGTPIWVHSPGSFTVNYTITVQGQQMTPVTVKFDLINEYGAVVATHTAVIPAASLLTGVNALTFTFDVPANLPDGFYTLRVCIDDGHDPICTTQPRSVRIDNTPPIPVVLERPASNQGCTWVTGNQYELFGYAVDNFGVTDAWFQYTLTPTDPTLTPTTPLTIAATAVAGFPGEYSALWNSSEVPDTTPGAPGYMRFVAKDAAGNVATSGWTQICIENRVKVELQKGWNLISTPLLLYQPAVADVLANIWCPAGDPSCVNMGGWRYPANATPIDKIYTFRNGATPDWTWWSSAGPDGVSAIADGYGYWVHTVAPATIEFIGTWLSIGPVAPPEYAVKAGWNLIGYTHWGTPTDQNEDKLVSEYLGFPMMVSVESMYRYDARLGRYVMVDEMTGEQKMQQGAGYWLALAQGTEGTINP